VLLTNLDKSSIHIFLHKRLVFFGFLIAHILYQLEFMVFFFVN
jgi:hypothetical protein